MPIVVARAVGPSSGWSRLARRFARPRSAGRWTLLIGGLLVGLTGCGSDSGDDQGAPVSAGAVAGSSASAIASPAAAPVGSVSVGREAGSAIEGPPTPPTPSGSPAPFRSAVADIGPIVWATEVDPRTNAPLQTVSTFPLDAPTIVAAVPVARWEPAAVVSAEWSYNGTPLDAFATTVRVDSATRDVWIAFRLGKQPEASWPDGVYAISLLVDGRVAQSSAVAVVAPEQSG